MTLPRRSKPRSLALIDRRILRLVWKPHEPPDERVVDPFALHALRVDRERHPRIVVAELAHYPAQIATSEEAEARERPPQRVRRDPLGQQHPALSRTLLVHALDDALRPLLVAFALADSAV